jgi:hypothetical protein
MFHPLFIFCHVLSTINFLFFLIKGESCVLGLRPFALFNEYLFIKKKKKNWIVFILIPLVMRRLFGWRELLRRHKFLR